MYINYFSYVFWNTLLDEKFQKNLVKRDTRIGRSFLFLVAKLDKEYLWLFWSIVLRKVSREMYSFLSSSGVL